MHNINQNWNPITQVMDYRSSVLGSHAGPHWNYGIIEHENGLKF